MKRWRGVLVAGVVASLACLTPQSFGQFLPQPRPGQGVVGGVYVDPDGALRAREQDPKELADVRAKARDKTALTKLIAVADGPVTCVSLPRAFAKAKEAIDAGKPIPADIKYLAGLTRIRYVFLYPDEKDLVIAGPAEAYDASANPTQPLGKTTGRPVLQLDDLVVALRSTQPLHGGGGGFLGCSIDNKPGSLKLLQDLIAKYQNGPRETLKKEIAAAWPPQTVSVIGVPADSRLALALVAADYRLKTICMNIEPSPIAGIGHIVSDERTSAARLWYELSYQPIAVSKDNTAFEFRGPRVKVLAGSQMYDARGATVAADNFAGSFSKHMDELAAVMPAIADLQNVADDVMLASLIQTDKLDARSGWDTAWLYNAKSYPTASYTVPKTTPTLVGITGISVVCGGVSMTPGSFVQPTSRALSEKDLPKNRPAEGDWMLSPADTKSK